MNRTQIEQKLTDYFESMPMLHEAMFDYLLKAAKTEDIEELLKDLPTTK